MKIRMKLAVLGLLLATASGGCAPTLDPNFIPQHFSKQRLERMEITVIRLTGTLRDSRGQGVGNVTVLAESPRHTDRTKTANDGFFEVTAKLAEGDTIDFHFLSLGKLEWTESVGSLPKGVEMITLRFKQSDRGTVKLASLEY